MRLVIEVVKVKGKCAVGYKPGDYFVFNSFYIEPTKAKICLHALSAMQNILYAIAHGISPKALGVGDENTAYVQCPDPGKPFTDGGTVLFRIRRCDNDSNRQASNR